MGDWLNARRVSFFFFFLSIYDHSSHYIVILCNVAFHLIWAHSYNLAVAFYWNDKICDTRRPFTFIRRCDDQLTYVRACVCERVCMYLVEWECNEKLIYWLERSLQCSQRIENGCIVYSLLMHTYGCSLLKTTRKHSITNHTRILNNITTEKRMSHSFCIFIYLLFLLQCYFFCRGFWFFTSFCLCSCVRVFVCVCPCHRLLVCPIALITFN